MGYKKIMNLPDYPEGRYQTVKLQTPEELSGKSQPAAGFSEPGRQGAVRFHERILPGYPFLSALSATLL
jgi:hypothetical protein